MGGFRKLNKLICLILHHVCYRSNVFVLVVPAFIWVLPSNQYDDDVEPQCTGIQGVLTCPGSASILFEESNQMMKVYSTSTHGNKNSHKALPYVAMSFDPPLEELSKYYYYEGGNI